jgi:hypothetical protein
MAVDAVHLTALDELTVDSRVPPVAREALRRHYHHARAGALLVDLPYFGGFVGEMVRYAMRRPAKEAPWGDRFHRQAPVRLLGALLAEAARTRSAPLQALALGYATHIGVDSTLHPPVNRLVARRLAPLGRLTDDDAAQHREVEKYQSFLLHHARYGRSFLGTSRFFRHVHVPAAQLLVQDVELSTALRTAIAHALGDAPPATHWRAWGRGYLDYIRLLASPVGRTLIPPRVHDWARATFYKNDDLDYEVEFTRALRAAAEILEAAEPLLSGQPLPSTTLDAFHARVPERSLDFPERPFA